MDAEKIEQDLTRRFSQPLPEFYRRRIIFWYDEDKEFEEQVDSLNLPDVKVIKLTGSNSFAVKKLLTVDDTISNYLVYCPLSYEDAEDNWLINIELYSGETFRADLNTIWMDEMGLPSSPTLRNQVKQYHKFFNNKERRAKFSAIANAVTSVSQLHLAVMAVICGLKEISPSDIIRSVLMDGLDVQKNEKYQSIVSFGAQAPFWALIAQASGYQNQTEPNLYACATHIVLTGATRTLHKEYLAGLDNYISTPHQSFCYDFISEWLHSDDLDAFYPIAREIEDKLRLFQRFSKLGIEDIRDTECFPCINEVILMKLMAEVKDDLIQNDLIASTAEKRRTLAWYGEVSDYYEGLMEVAKMQSFYLDHSIGFHTATAGQIWNEYTTDYFKMDSYYRQYQLCFQRSLKHSNDLLDDLFKHVTDKVESLYSGWFLTKLGENWANISSEELEKGYIQGVSKQENFYDNNIRKSDSRVFVIISDALRYEVAESLVEQLRRETQCTVDLDSMCGIYPTITPYGMAALLPHKELSVTQKANGNLSVLADGNATDSQNRDAILKAANPNSVALQYKNIVGMKKAERCALVKGMDVVYIYHDKIDEASHTSDDSVFVACDEAIDELKNMVRIIANEFSGTRIFITADHGFLYTYSPLSEDDKLSKNNWNGHEVEYGRRYCIMDADIKPEYLQPVSFLGGKTPYFAYAPKENVRIKMNGSGMNYVHGGISLQEMVVPLIDYHYLRNDSKEYQKNKAKIDTKPVTVSLLSANRKISNMIFSLNFYQKEAVGDNREPATYELYFTDSTGKQVSDIAKIIADKTNENMQERTFRCGFNLKSLHFDNKETYYLVIADENGLQIPQREEFQIDIAFAVDEFNFF